MHIVHISSELAPIAKVGGLADVVLGLSRELSWKGHQVDIIIPKYDCINKEQIRELEIIQKDVMSFYQGEWYANTIWRGKVENLYVYFIESHHPRAFFERGCFYGCEDDIERFLYFSRAALEFIYKSSSHPDIIHLHDWETAIIAPLYQDIYQPLGFTRSKIVLTIHNMEYQGRCASHDLDYVGLNGMEYHHPDRMQDNLYPELVNLLKGGIIYSNFITTVSSNYAKEVLTTEGGKGLEFTLLKYQDKFTGILNGIDYSYWNPEIDRFLPIHYSAREKPAYEEDRNTIHNKSQLKKILRQKLKLADDHRPLIGCITRLVPQKGIDLIKYTMQHIVEKHGQFVLLGSSPIESIQAEFERLKQMYTNHPHIHLILNHQEEMAHLIFGGTDAFIVPSLFEPCGLTQLIALKYGSVPIVRRTGGLADTIFDVDHSERPLKERNGYTFDYPDAVHLDAALNRALHCWSKEPKKWHQLMLNGMNIDYSWNRSSNLYLDIYKKVLGQEG